MAENPHSQLASQDFERKLAQREKERSYYEVKVSELGLSSVERFRRFHPSPSRLLRAGGVFAHRDLEGVISAMGSQTSWAAVAGVNPSGPLHLGHLAIFQELRWLQDQGAEVHIPITDDESYLTGKTPSLAVANRTAHESIIPSLRGLGFLPERSRVYVDTDTPGIYTLAMELSKSLTINKAQKVFGFSPEENPGIFFYRSAVQLAQILLPQYPEYGGPKPSVIVVGIDQYPYLLLARDVAEKRGLTLPAGLFVKFLWGLDGLGKMSASRPASAIFLDETPEVAARKIKRSYTGGSSLASFQQEKGGVPEICPIYTLRAYHFEKDDSLKVACSTGKILCGDCKAQAISQVTDYLEEHQRLVQLR
jgi:tryptophanyl-tRNA synthetase